MVAAAVKAGGRFGVRIVGQGRDAAKKEIKEKPELAAKLTKAIMDKVTVTGGTALAVADGTA